MTRRTTLQLALAAALVAGCAANVPAYRAWEGEPTVYKAGAGTRVVVDGVDLWLDGTPSRPFRIIGVLVDNRSDGRSYEDRMTHAVAAKVRDVGGDAAILRAAGSESTAAVRPAGSAIAMAVIDRTARFLVIRYER